MSTEADTCRTLITPKLQAAGWDSDPHSLTEQRYFTDGRIVVRGGRAERRKGKRADYILRYTRDFPIAIVEAKAEAEPAASGLQQSKDYAEILGLKFAYTTNGIEIIEFDYITGQERTIPQFPTPDELWSHLRAAESLSDDAAAQRLLTPLNLTTGKIPHYYQEIAISRAVQSILQAKRRVLLTMATGTGKTIVAFHICWKLWSSKWNRQGDPNRKPRILYLADRNFLVDDPKDKIFAPFGDARHKIEGGVAVFSRELYFATYQSIAKDANRPGLYKEFAPDFFDLVIVDECHRGSARDDSNWREILDHFAPAYQLGMTATPLRDENRDTYPYFGNPVYTYSLKQGIDDGFLAPYRVHRIVTQWDAAGWRPSKDDLDRYGRVIPDEQYQTADFERIVALRARTKAIAKHLTEFLKKTDRFAKTIVFCVDQEHASEMRTALNNLNADLVGHPRPSDGSGAGGEGMRSRKLYFDGGYTDIATHLVYELDSDGNQLRVIKLTDYTAEKVRTRAKKAKGQRLNAKVNDVRTVSTFSLQPLAFPSFPRRQRADRVKKQQAAMFNYLKPEAQEILNELLEKYASDGELQFVLPDVLKVPPISQHGSVWEIVGVFGGPDELRNAVNQLQSLLYAA
ncbi:MAG: DEAD/DEAH box helicase family protein [Verrucomicrobia bacterium]|nr:DEAD/DEAH box helicase family protein [Verrucomicrobiota bacterium]